MSWKNLKIKGIPQIDKVLAEFQVWELEKTPWAKFRVKVIEEQNGEIFAITNLMYIDETGGENPGCAYGKTIEEALEKCIKNFLSYLPEDRELTEKDFTTSDPYDF